MTDWRPIETAPVARVSARDDVLLWLEPKNPAGYSFWVRGRKDRFGRFRNVPQTHDPTHWAPVTPPDRI